MPKVADEHTEIVWARIDSIVTLILENDRYLQSKRNEDLTKIVMEKLGVAERTALRYVKEAKKEIRKIGQSKKQEHYIRAIRDREFLFQKAKQVEKDPNGKIISFPDYKLALEIVKDRDKLNGLYVDEVKLNGTIENKIDFGAVKTEDIITLINELKKLNTRTE